MESDRHRAVIQIVDTNLPRFWPFWRSAIYYYITVTVPISGVRFIPIGLAIVASCAQIW